MKTTLYVFSATGNTLTTARKLAAYFENVTIRSISALYESERIIDDSDYIGFLFPVYYGDIPWPVRKLVENLELTSSPYLFAVSTSRGHVRAAYPRIDRILHYHGGHHLSYCVNIRMPGNSYIDTPEDESAALNAQDEAIRTAVEPILRREVSDYTSDDLFSGSPASHPNNFRGITADSSCIGCGTCTTVCPMHNITIENGKAILGDDCTTCLSCFHWCPTESIWMSKLAGLVPDTQAAELERRRKYHHPDITLSDIQSLIQNDHQ